MEFAVFLDVYFELKVKEALDRTWDCYRCIQGGVLPRMNLSNRNDNCLYATILVRESS